MGFEELVFLGLLRIVGAGFVSLAEEITNELLGAFIKVVEVLRHTLGFVIPAKIKSQLDLVETIAVGRESGGTLPVATTENWGLVGRAFTYTLVARHCKDREELGF